MKTHLCFLMRSALSLVSILLVLTASPFTDNAEASLRQTRILPQTGNPSIDATPWFRQFGTSYGDTGRSVTTDSSGNVYVAGSCYSPNTGDDDAFISKFNSSGTEQWRRQFGAMGNEGFNSVAVDSAGNVFVAGFAPGWGSDAFICKYDASGIEQWSRKFGDTNYGGSSNDSLSSIALDSSGNVYVAGAAGYDAFLGKYNGALGGELWSRVFSPGGIDNASSVALDSSGNVYVAGYSNNGATGDAFIGKYDSSGTAQWTHQFGTGNVTYAKSLAVSSTGNIYVAGYTGGVFSGQTSPGSLDAFISRYDSSGTQQWVRQYGSSSEDYVYSVAVDSAENFYLAGRTLGAFSGQTPSGNFDAFMSKYSSSGDQQWTRQFGTSGGDCAYSVAVDSSDNTYLAGYTEGTFYGQTSAGPGYSDAFVGKNVHQLLAISQLIFTNVAQSLTAGAASAAMTVQARDALYLPRAVAGSTTIGLTSSSTAGRFDASATGAFDGSITSVIIPSGSSSATFYYKDGSAGTPTITAAESPSQGWTDATQQETISGAEFTASVTLGAAPLTITFTDQSTTPTSWSWAFGDGTTSSTRNPTKTYTQGGIYTVSLTASGNWGSHTKTKTNYISVIEARFSATPTSGLKPLTTNFTDESRGAVTGWSWSFGDGTGSSSQNPTKTYNNGGAHTVILTVTGPAGSSTMARSSYISVNELQMISAFRQSIGADGVVLLDVRINRLRHPVTDVDTPATGGIRSYDFTLTYPGGTTGNAVNILATRGAAPFTSPTSDWQNAAGSTRVTATQTGSAPQAPLTLAQVAPRIIGSKNVSHTVTLSFSGLTDVTGVGNIPQDAAHTFIIQRGDAKKDGNITITDALFVAQYLAGLRGVGETATDMHAINAASVRTDDTTDTTGDKVTITDALFIAQMLAGLRDESYR